MKLKYITTIASLPSSPALSKNSREVQDARERFGDSGQAAAAGGQEGVCRSIGVYYPGCVSEGQGHGWYRVPAR